MSHESARLRYEKITVAHAKRLREALCDPRVYRFIDDGSAPTPEDLATNFKLREQGPPPGREQVWFEYAVIEKGTGAGIGRVEATVVQDRAEVAYLLGPAYWGLGYGRESLAWLESFVADRHPILAFWATVMPGNDASRGLLLASGYAETSVDPLPPLTSYDPGDWVFCKRRAADA